MQAALTSLKKYSVVLLFCLLLVSLSCQADEQVDIPDNNSKRDHVVGGRIHYGTYLRAGVSLVYWLETRHDWYSSSGYFLELSRSQRGYNVDLGGMEFHEFGFMRAGASLMRLESSRSDKTYLGVTVTAFLMATVKLGLYYELDRHKPDEPRVLLIQLGGGL